MKNKNNIPQGYKDSSLGAIPEEWEVKKIVDICQILVGKDLKESNYSDTKTSVYDIPVYSNTIDKFGLYGYYNFEEYTGNSVTVVGRGVGLGTAFARKEGFGAIGRLLVLYPYEGIHYEYIANYINDRINILFESAAIPQLTGVQFSSYNILCPPLPEQRKIAEILTLWDSAIEKQTQLIEKLETRKRGLMQQLLTGKKRLKGFDGELRELKLGNLGETYNGLTGKSKDDFGKGKPYIPYLNIFNNPQINIFSFDYVSIEEGEFQNKVQYGDVLFTVSSETPDEVGMASVLLDNIDDLYLNSFCFGFRLSDFKTLLPEFACYFFRANTFRADIYKLSQGATRFNLSKASLMRLNVILPNIEEQTAISNILMAADKEIELAKNKLAALKEQKKGLMQVLLTGKKRIKI